MENVEKIKSHLIITLDNGKQTYFDFSDHKFYGVSRRPVKQFSADAYKVLNRYAGENFLAMFFNEKPDIEKLTSGSIDYIGMAETIYSIYHETCSLGTLWTIYDYCKLFDIKLDGEHIKKISKALDVSTAEENTDMRQFPTSWEKEFAYYMKRISFGDISEKTSRILVKTSEYYDVDMEMLIRDAKKIDFYLIHEGWEETAYYCNVPVHRLLGSYFYLCRLLNKVPTYKNLFLQIGHYRMEYLLAKDSLMETFQKDAPLFYEDDIFSVVIPTTAKEFQEEADNQHNCVFRLYYSRVHDKLTHIVFIRRKNNLDKSYITCEVSNKGEIVQYLAKYNNDVEDKDALAFRQNYQNYLFSQFNKV